MNKRGKHRYFIVNSFGQKLIKYVLFVKNLPTFNKMPARLAKVFGWGGGQALSQTIMAKGNNFIAIN